MAENNKNVNEDAEDWKEYDQPVKFIVGTNQIGWYPDEDTLSAVPGSMAKEIANSVEELIMYLDDRGYIQVTPEGPSLPATVKNLYTVVWAFNELYKDEGVEVEGDAPTLADMGIDEASNYDENGNEIVR